MTAALGNPRRDLSRGLPVATADIKNLIGAFEVQRRKGLFRHGRLEARDPGVLRCVPLRHTPAFWVTRDG